MALSRHGIGSSSKDGLAQRGDMSPVRVIKSSLEDLPKLKSAACHFTPDG